MITSARTLKRGVTDPEYKILCNLHMHVFYLQNYSQSKADVNKFPIIMYKQDEIKRLHDNDKESQGFGEHFIS